MRGVSEFPEIDAKNPTRQSLVFFLGGGGTMFFFQDDLEQAWKHKSFCKGFFEGLLYNNCR